MKTYKKRYYLSYADPVRTVSKNSGFPMTQYVRSVFETDDEDEFNSMLKLAQETNCYQIEALDTVSKKVICTYRLDGLTKWRRNSLAYYKILELYFGDGKTLKDFVDPNIAARDEMRKKNDPYYSWSWYNNRSERDAESKFEKYLKEKWSRSSKKKLPDLVIYDDPHMTEKEIEERKKADKEKINKIVERCGW